MKHKSLITKSLKLVYFIAGMGISHVITDLASMREHARHVMNHSCPEKELVQFLEPMKKNGICILLVSKCRCGWSYQNWTSQHLTSGKPQVCSKIATDLYTVSGLMYKTNVENQFILAFLRFSLYKPGHIRISTGTLNNLLLSGYSYCPFYLTIYFLSGHHIYQFRFAHEYQPLVMPTYLLLQSCPVYELSLRGVY